MSIITIATPEQAAPTIAAIFFLLVRYVIRQLECCQGLPEMLVVERHHLYRIIAHKPQSGNLAIQKTMSCFGICFYAVDFHFFFWLSMYLLTTSKETAPTDDIKQLLLQSDGSLDFNFGNILRNSCARKPFSRVTAFLTTKVGGMSIRRWTWSGITSMSRITIPKVLQYWGASSFIFFPIWSSNTWRRYFGQNTTWYWQL